MEPSSCSTIGGDGDGGAPAELLHLGAVLHLARDPATRAAARESLPAAVAAAGALAPRVTA